MLWGFLLNIHAILEKLYLRDSNKHIRMMCRDQRWLIPINFSEIFLRNLEPEDAIHNIQEILESRRDRGDGGRALPKCLR